MNISSEEFAKELFELLEETFETHHGLYLDKGTSLIETLEQITAAEASIPVGGRWSTPLTIWQKSARLCALSENQTLWSPEDCDHASEADFSLFGPAE